MPLDEEAKKQLIEKIREHRRRIWLGEIADVREEKSREIKKRLGLEEVAPEPLAVKPSRRKLSKREREFREGEEEKPKVSPGLVALVITGLITAIAVGVLIGYLLATFM